MTKLVKALLLSTALLATGAVAWIVAAQHQAVTDLSKLETELEEGVFSAHPDMSLIYGEYAHCRQQFSGAPKAARLHCQEFALRLAKQARQDIKLRGLFNSSEFRIGRQLALLMKDGSVRTYFLRRLIERTEIIAEEASHELKVDVGRASNGDQEKLDHAKSKISANE